LVLQETCCLPCLAIVEMEGCDVERKHLLQQGVHEGVHVTW
jgi:hypothetical protein